MKDQAHTIGLRAGRPPEKSSQPRTKEERDFSIRDIFELYSRHRSVLTLCVLSGIVCAILHHVYLRQYNAGTVIYITSASDSPLQQFAARMVGTSSATMFKGDDDEVDKYMLHLSAFSFFLEAAKKLKETPFYKDTLDQLDILDEEGNERVSFIGKFARLLDPPTKESVDVEALLADALSDRTTQKKGVNGSINITFTAPNRRLAVVISNLLAETATNSIVSIELKELNNAYEYLSNEVMSSAGRLKDISKSTVEFMTANHLLSQNPEADGLTGRLIEIEGELEAARIQFEQNKSVISSLSTQMRDQRRKIPGMETQEDDADPSVARSENLRYGAVDTLTQLIDQNRLLKARVEVLGAVSKELKRYRGPAMEAELVGLKRKTELEYTMLEELRKNMINVEVERNAIRTRASIVEAARIRKAKANIPIVAKLAIGLFLGLLLSFGYASIVETLWPKVNSSDELEAMGMKFLGSIPDLKRLAKMTGKTMEAVCSYDTESPMSISLSQIRTMILHFISRSAVRPKLIVFIGGESNEGKSFVACNIAASLAQAKKKTLMIDSDLRKPSATQTFGLSNSRGVYDILKNDESWESLVHREVRPNLDVICAGELGADHMNLFVRRDRLQKLFQDVREKYDFIVVDTPALLAVSDALVVASMGDLLVVTVAHMQTQISKLLSVVTQLRDVTDIPVYSILNKFRKFNPKIYAYGMKISASKLSVIASWKGKGPTDVT